MPSSTSLTVISPFLSWIPFVSRDSLKADFFAGLTRAVIVLPQGVAFATIAGLPPEYGLYTAMVTPIVAALTRQTIEDLAAEYDEQLRSLGVGATGQIGTLLWDARFSLLTTALAGFGRAIAEVGAVIIVGGNINHVTRVMTTTIALETSKGNLALALGVVLLTIALIVNAAVMAVRASAVRAAYA